MIKITKAGAEIVKTPKPRVPSNLKNVKTEDLINELIGRDDIYVLNWYYPHHIKEHLEELERKEISLKKAKSILNRIKKENFGADDASEGIFDYAYEIYSK